MSAHDARCEMAFHGKCGCERRSLARFLWELVVFGLLCVGWFAAGCIAAMWMTQ